MKTLLGTNCFPSCAAAEHYYWPCLFGKGVRHCKSRDSKLVAWVSAKILAKEIVIGKPAVKSGQEVIIKDDRYHIAE